MRIHCLKTENFRNLSHPPVEFSPGVNLFIGDNGHGKTNILESIHLFKFGRSFRTLRDEDLIKFGEPFCRVEVETRSGRDGAEVFSATVERGGAKRIKIGDKDVPLLSELVGRYPCVLFGPQDLVLVSGPPAERRRFLDMTGSMTDKQYLHQLRAYRRALNQRNTLLRSGGPDGGKRAWDEELVREGCALLGMRLRLVDAMRGHVRDHAESLSVPFEVDIEYESALIDPAAPGGEGCEEVFAARLADVAADETRRRTTLAGPHRDDLRLRADGKDLRRYGSQGQRRLSAVLLRLAELSYLEAVLQEPCVLLLDDLFSELDPRVSEKMRGRLGGPNQIFVTSPVEIGWQSEGACCRFQVSEGRVEVNA